MNARRTVFILGAGASAEGGAPLMRNFRDAAEMISRSDRCEDQDDFALVFRGIAALQRVYAKASLDTVNLEAVFSAFEMADLISRLPGLEADELPRLAPALRTVIARTLEHTLRFPINPKGFREAPVPYQLFVDGLLRRMGATKAAAITFNYDLGLDYAFIRHGEQIEYGLTEERSSGFPILKLHGSLNWLLCEKCTAVRACNPKEIADRFARIDDQMVRMCSLDQPINCPQCLTPASDRFLVAPTLSKGEGHRAIRNVWRHAAEMLSTAENIFVIGYSLPSTDEFFRYLFALGTISDLRPKAFWVFDPSPEVGPKFEHFLGPTMKERFTYILAKFGGALSYLPYSEGGHWPPQLPRGVSSTAVSLR